MKSKSQFDALSPHKEGGTRRNKRSFLSHLCWYSSLLLSVESSGKQSWLLVFFGSVTGEDLCVCEECAVTLLISKLMAYEFEGRHWLIRQIATSQQLMHIDMVKGSVNIWLTASFVCCIYSFVVLSSKLLMCCNSWTCRSWQIAQ